MDYATFNYLLDPATYLHALRGVEPWIRTNVLGMGNVIQFFAIALSYLPARFLRGGTHRLLQTVRDKTIPKRFHARLAIEVSIFALPVVWLALLGLAHLAIAKAGGATQLTGVALSLLTAWIVIRLAANFIADPWWARAMAATVWVLAALNILGLLAPTITVLDTIALTFGKTRISVLGVFKTMIALAVMLWMANLLSSTIERRIGTFPNLTPSLRVLFGKLLRIALITLAVLVALESVGIDLTALTVFSGALGLGLGFGLQKVASNLVSGVILLLDRSVKPGDVIAIGETYGWINSLGARYVSVVTRDGIEHLIPNEELISSPVENWSYTDRLVRQHLPFGVSYTSDLHKARALAIEAATSFERILKTPEPRCLLKGYGDSAVNLELRVWIQDAEKGLSNIKSDIYFKIWDLYHENGVEFPFPQRDIHIKGTVPVSVETATGRADVGAQKK
ncbi:mechanosensitive ion channel family protein [Varunaivibrio sulfuroxidans]|uniref:Mechanosensitive ion channel-like protein n=1 Tax=Varunaivibrio sulfuroxidans TaxID=1773489 RepID=A0A4R3J6F4_9PROT|nr:mechanosensitive ion channel domain-containing protein [Varunaivibrio sulfuroxidans]TCS60957.1 mechanosensitive ion channel-like protein [Varunaivibrio sulfuroxidans]WES31637.1 mechanosensitive ion channel [Varunaivibrio sulfuroxidans]